LVVVNWPGRERTMADQKEERKRKIIGFIRDFATEHHYPPTIREIGKYIGVKSTSLVIYYLDELEREGIIARSERISRSIWVKENQ
jgi:repressor LexA